MKAGTENKRQLIILGVLLVIALIGMWRMFSGESAPAPAAKGAETASTTKKAAGRRRSGNTNRHLWGGVMKPNPLDPTLQVSWLKTAEQTEYTGGDRNIFSDTPDQPKVVTPAVDPNKVAITTPQPPPGPPPPPPIN